MKLAEAPSYGQSVFEYAPDSSGARDYELLAEEVIAQEGQRPAPSVLSPAQSPAAQSPATAPVAEPAPASPPAKASEVPAEPSKALPDLPADAVEWPQRRASSG